MWIEPADVIVVRMANKTGITPDEYRKKRRGGEKHCPCCKEWFPVEDFGPHKSALDSLQCRCRKCHRLQCAEYRAGNLEKVRENGRRGQGKWALRNKGKTYAHGVLQRAIRDGKLSRPESCSMCGARGNIVGHHDDYENPLAVTWLCNVCHAATHRGESFEQN